MKRLLDAELKAEVGFPRNLDSQKANVIWLYYASEVPSKVRFSINKF